jgi:uncharacterized membrane protein YbjE (DUF340 family)
MFTVIIIMTIGIVIGAAFHKRTAFIQGAERVITYAIWLLLFLLGVSVGANKLIMSNIGTLGIQALLLSFSAMAGSIVLSYFLFAYFFTHES